MSARPIWFGPTDRPLFGWFHLPDDSRARGAVVICPPVGRDLLQAHYALRRLAVRLEAKGFCVLRFDYDGTGDSAGLTTDPGRLEAWLRSIGSALDVVREAGATRVALVGMRLGATLAAEGARRQGPVDELVLWDPALSGQWFLNEQRALAALSLGVTPTRPDGSLENPGLVYQAETVRQLRALRIGSCEGSLADHVLVLSRPGSDDSGLRTALATGEVEWGEATGQAELIDRGSPEQVLPDVAIDRIVTWLTGHAALETTAMSCPDAAGTITLSMNGNDAAVVERPLTLGPLALFSFVTQPATAAGGTTIVFLSVANEHHIGPNRLWVELARQLACSGVRSVRVDLSGLGDSPVRRGQPEFVSRASWAFDDVVDIAGAVSPDDPSNIVLVGLCSAAYQALESALDLRPRGVMAINPVLSFQAPEVLAGDRLDPRRRIALPRGPIVQAFHHEGPLSPLRRRFPNLGWRIRTLMTPGRRPAVWLKRLAASDVDVLLVCGETEARPIQQGASERTMRKLLHGGRFRYTFIPALDHGLLRADHRELVSTMLTDHVLERFGPARQGVKELVPPPA